jgi:uncharacterized protein YecT (DUF1311 family)
MLGYRILFFLFLSLLFVFGELLPGKAYAQRHGGYCDAAESTADTLDCVNRHKNDVQDRLNEVYNTLSMQQEAEKSKTALGDAQQAWIGYRDAQCKWESGLAGNPSLERIYELSCITLLTNMRTELLATTSERELEEEPREFGAHPRWINVLAHEYPDVFWRYGNWTKADLDCDGEDEQIITGVSFKQEQDSEQAPSLIVAISENPAIGKPSSFLLRIALRADNSSEEENQGPFLCKTDVSFSYVPDVHMAEQVQQKQEVSDQEQVKNGKTQSSCKAHIKIDDKACSPLLIRHKNDEYILQSKTKKEVKSEPADG